VRQELFDWLVAILRVIPGNIGLILRRNIYSLWFSGDANNLNVTDGVFVNGFKNINIGHHFSLGRNATIQSLNGTISIGKRCSFSHGVWIGSDFGDIKIGDDVLIGPYCVLRAANHKFERGVAIRDQGHQFSSIIIGDNVWIGAHVTIVPGVTIGSNSVIAAGAVVTRDIPSDTLCGGVPATVIRSLDKKE